MSGEKKRIPLAEAEQLATRVIDRLWPSCVRIEVAGSIRRRSETVGDIEIICVPIVDVAQADLFGGAGSVPTDRVTACCAAAIADGTFGHRPDKNGHRAFGERLKRLTFRGFALDVFSVLPPAQWGVLVAIRTGPADFSHRLVTSRSHGGLLPNWLKVRDGAIWNGETTLETPEERDVFRVVGLDWIPPEKRTGQERPAIVGGP